MLTVFLTRRGFAIWSGRRRFKNVRYRHDRQLAQSLAPCCDCLRLLAPNLSGSLSLWRPNDECASGGFDDVFGDGVEVVDSQDAVDLGEEAVE